LDFIGVLYMKKLFIITVDTESDNQWDSNNVQSTKNALYVPRFQELCEKYAFKPVYLVDYSMANDEFLVEYLSDCEKRGMCEIGMHLHAWDTPPFAEIDEKDNVRPYLIEYSKEVMEAKVATLDKLLKSKFKCNIVSHRAGRWAMNDEYFNILKKYGYKVDCSFTPGIDWSKVIGFKKGGSDYSKVLNTPHFHKKSGIFEVPATVKKMRYLKKISTKEFGKFILGRKVWIRPAINSNEEILTLIDHNSSAISEFMMHSSELMPAGSPYFKTSDEIEELYRNLENLFDVISKTHKGITLCELYEDTIKKIGDQHGD